MSDYIFTTHALERLQQRSISQSDAELVMRHPDYTKPGNKPGAVKFIKVVNDRNVQLVATYLKDQNKWLVVSAWVRGEEDKIPLTWQLLTAPFKALWWLAKFVWKQVRKSA